MTRRWLLATSQDLFKHLEPWVDLPFAQTPMYDGMHSEELLDSQRRGLQARVGLAIVLVCAAVVVYNDPTESPADLIFSTALFGVA